MQLSYNEYLEKVRARRLCKNIGGTLGEDDLWLDVILNNTKNTF